MHDDHFDEVEDSKARSGSHADHPITRNTSTANLNIFSLVLHLSIDHNQMNDFLDCASSSTSGCNGGHKRVIRKMYKRQKCTYHTHYAHHAKFRWQDAESFGYVQKTASCLYLSVTYVIRLCPRLPTKLVLICSFCSMNHTC